MARPVSGHLHCPGGLQRQFELTCNGSGGHNDDSVVALNSSTGTTIVQQGAQMILSATVTADPTNAGVNWALSGDGTLSNMTKKSVTYTAPTGVTGSISPILTATSIADTAQAEHRVAGRHGHTRH